MEVWQFSRDFDRLEVSKPGDWECTCDIPGSREGWTINQTRWSEVVSPLAIQRMTGRRGHQTSTPTTGVVSTMFGPMIENHEPISYMSLGYAVEVVERVHKYCFVTICGKKRQAMAIINEAARRAGAVAL